MKRFVIGFAFRLDGQDVLLINKNRPQWQAGRINGIGGVIEDGETPIGAMQREFAEETGVNIDPIHWQLFCRMDVLKPETAELYIYKTQHLSVKGARRITDEKPEWFSVNALPVTVISNLKWLIPMALSCVSAYVIEEYRGG